MNLTVQDLLRQNARIQDLYFNISKMKLSITLFAVQIISYLGASNMIYSDVIASFLSEILRYKMSVIVSSTEKPWAVLFTPKTSKYKGEKSR